MRIEVKMKNGDLLKNEDLTFEQSIDSAIENSKMIDKMVDRNKIASEIAEEFVEQLSIFNSGVEKLKNFRLNTGPDEVTFINANEISHITLFDSAAFALEIHASLAKYGL